MNEKKVAFIMCTNDKQYYEECCLYIRDIKVPEGFEVEIYGIENATGITSAYNKVMHESDAKYKVYIHQDVFLLNEHLIEDILTIFEDERVGMIGVIGGASVIENARYASSWDKGVTIANNTASSFQLIYSQEQEEVYAIDGMLMITQYDIPWNEEITGWHFYDISQSIEFHKAGYKVVVPKQEFPWAMHDAGACSENHYDEKREKFCGLYAEEGHIYRKEEDTAYREIQRDFLEAKKNILSHVGKISPQDLYQNTYDLLNIYINDTELLVLLSIIEIYVEEMQAYGDSRVLNVANWQELYCFYKKIKFYLIRIQFGFSEELYLPLRDMVFQKEVTIKYIQALMKKEILEQKKVLDEVQRILQ